LLDEDETMAAKFKVVLDDFWKAALVGMYVEYGSVSWAYENFYQFNRKPVGSAFYCEITGWCERYEVFVSTFENLANTCARKCQPNKPTCVLHLFLFSHNGHIEKGLHVFRMIKDYMVLQRRPHGRDQLEVIQLNWHASKSWKFKSWSGKEYKIDTNDAIVNFCLSITNLVSAPTFVLLLENTLASGVIMLRGIIEAAVLDIVDVESKT
jgi:hypothetical protein